MHLDGNVEVSAENVEKLSQEEVAEWRGQLQDRVARLSVPNIDSLAARMLAGMGGKLMQPGTMST